MSRAEKVRSTNTWTMLKKKQPTMNFKSTLSLFEILATLALIVSSALIVCPTSIMGMIASNSYLVVFILFILGVGFGIILCILNWAAFGRPFQAFYYCQIAKLFLRTGLIILLDFWLCLHQVTACSFFDYTKSLKRKKLIFLAFEVCGVMFYNNQSPWNDYGELLFRGGNCLIAFIN